MCVCVCVCVCVCALHVRRLYNYIMHIIISFIMYYTLCVPIVSQATYIITSDAPVGISIPEDTTPTYNFMATLFLSPGFTLDTTIVLDIELVSGDSSGT